MLRTILKGQGGSRVQLDHCNNPDLYQSGHRGGGEEWTGPGHILEVEPTGFSNGLVVRSERKSGIKDDSTFWRVSNQKDEVVTE